MCHSRQNIGSGRVCWWWPQPNPCIGLTVAFNLTGSWDPPSSHGKHIFFLQVDSPGEVSQQAERWQWPSLVVAFTAVRLVMWLGLEISCPSGRYGLDSLDPRLREPQSWRQGLLEVRLLHSLMFLSLNKSPDRDMTGPWHATSPSSTTQRVWNFLQGAFYKNLDLKVRKHTYPWTLSWSCRLLEAFYSSEHGQLHTSHCLCIPSWSYRQLEALHSHGQKDLHITPHPCTPSASCRQMKAPHSHGERELWTIHNLCVTYLKINVEIDEFIGYFFWYLLSF